MEIGTTKTWQHTIKKTTYKKANEQTQTIQKEQTNKNQHTNKNKQQPNQIKKLTKKQKN